MSMTLSSMKTSKTIVSASNRVACEWDIIVPDAKPDIGTILKTDAKAEITGYEIMQDRAIINGTLHLNLIYLSMEKDHCKAIETSQNFSHIAELKGLRQNMELNLEASIDKSAATILNSRKINYSASIIIDANVVYQNEMEFVGEMEEDNLCTLTKELKTYQTVCEGAMEIPIHEMMEIPMGKTSISDLLSLQILITDKETKPLHNKLMVKGKLSVYALYNGEIMDEEIQTAEHEIPFTEILDIEGITENSECDTEMILSNLQYTVKEDIEGQKRCIEISALLRVTTKSYENVILKALVDAYSTKYDIQTEKSEYCIDEIAGEINTQLLNKTVLRPDTANEIRRIYHYQIIPKVKHITVNDASIRIDGILIAELLYSAVNSSQPLYSIRQETPFTHHIPCEYATSDLDCEAKFDLIHADCTLTGNSEIEVKTTIAFRARLKKNHRNTLIKNIVIDKEKTIDRKHNGIIVYFCGENENLWDVGKKYQTPTEKIIAANGLLEDKEVVSGIQLLIP